MVKVRRAKERREFVPENFKVADFKEVKLKVAIDSMGKAKVYVLKENGAIDNALEVNYSSGIRIL